MQAYILLLAFLEFVQIKLQHVISNLGYHLEKRHPTRITDFAMPIEVVTHRSRQIAFTFNNIVYKIFLFQIPFNILSF